MGEPEPAPMADLLARLARSGERRREAATGGWPAEEEYAAALAVLQQDHSDPADPDEPRTGVALADVAAVFGLDEVDAAILWAAAAGDLDATVGLAFGLLRGVIGPARPTVSLALELAGVPTATPEAHARLGPDAPLRRHRLVDLTTSEPWLGRQLVVPDPVGAVLAGGLPVDGVVDRIRRELVPLEVDGVDTAARAIEQGVPLIWVRSAAGQSGTALAAGAFAQLGLHCLAIDLRRHQGPESLTDVVAWAARDAGLRGWGLVVVGCEVVGESQERAVFEALERAAVPVVAVSTHAWNPLWSTRFPLMLEGAPLSAEDRAGVWSDHLGEAASADPDLQETLLGLRLSGEDIAEASRYARVLARARGEELGTPSVREAARRVGGAGGSGADRLVPRSGGLPGPRFDDLVLPDNVSDSLHRLVSWVRHRDSLGDGGRLRGRARGISALFTGNPGTGKTLSAHVIAEELSIDLFQVDLSTIVDKYIGETEKNLERVFQAAEALDVVLFFDEADALFGKRSEVSDARDRYANQEVAYLLQRMESFDGLTILATNLRGNLDRAFSRRMSFIVHFPDPDAPTRVRLWEHHLGQAGRLDPDDPVAVGELAEAAEIAGGEIRNIVLAAAYDAAGEGVAVGNRHVVAAAVREFQKLGRVIPDDGFARAAGRSPSGRSRPRRHAAG